MARVCQYAHIRPMPASSDSPTGPENAAVTPIEIARGPLRLLVILLIANLAALIAVLTLAGLYTPLLADSDGLFLALGIGLGILAVALSCAPAVAFLVHTTRFATSVTPRLRRSALASAISPAVV